MKAVSDPVTFAPTPLAGPEPVLDAEEQGAERDLAHRAERLRTGGLKVDILVRVGSAPEVVAEVADAVGADLVVAGNTGKGTLERAVLGSVTTRLLHVHRRPRSSFPDSLYPRAL